MPPIRNSFELLIIQINQQLMAESPSLSNQKSANERKNLLARRISQLQASPSSFQESEGRSGYPATQPQLQERKIFGFQIYIDNDILSEIGMTIAQWFEALRQAHGVEHIGLNSDLTIPDLHGRNIQIYDVQMEKKYQCARAMLSQVYQAFKKNKKEVFSVIIFVPQGMVSLLIGAKGHQINKIMKQSHTTIVVNQPINRMTYRTAKIQGYHSDIAKACRIIYEMLEQKSSIAFSIQKQPTQLDYTKSKTKNKFIFNEEVVTFMQKKKKKLLQRIQEQTQGTIRFHKQKENRLLKRQEYICVMSGKLEDVQTIVVMLINICHQFLSQQKRNLDYTLKMLIPANYVTKLIGQKGYMIRDIIERSGGAMIKILSDKQEKDRECIISINGTKENKIDAACFIMEQIECFKNGGPILQSGKSINQNLAQQFKNSLPIHQAQHTAKQTITSLTERENTDVANNQGHHSSFLMKSKKKNQGSQEQGLIEVEEDQKQKQTRQKQEIERVQKEKRMAIQRDLQRINSIKKQREQSKKSKSPSHSQSKSRSRDKDKKKSKKIEFSKKGRSQSESVEYKHDRQTVEIKMLVPKKLGQDQKQLKYIQSLCKSTLMVPEQQKLQSGQVVISIRGSIKDNSRCLQLLQKRLARYKPTTSSTR